MSIKLLTCSLVLLTHVVHGQWHIGVKGGISFSNYKIKTPWKEVANKGAAFSITSFNQITPTLGVNLELGYIQKGYYHKICNSVTDQLKAHYVEIPMMIDYAFSIPWAKNFKGHINLGLYGAYWLSGKYKMHGFDKPMQNFDFGKTNTSRFDFGPNGGARIEYILLNGSLSLDFRYEAGMKDMQKKPDNVNNTNRTMIIGMSYMKLMEL